MKKPFLIGCSLVLTLFTKAQNAPATADTSWRTIYRESATRINDLVHTKLEVRFDYAKSWMYGKASSNTRALAIISETSIIRSGVKAIKSAH